MKKVADFFLQLYHLNLKKMRFSCAADFCLFMLESENRQAARQEGGRRVLQTEEVVGSCVAQWGGAKRKSRTVGGREAQVSDGGGARSASRKLY